MTYRSNSKRTKHQTQRLNRTLVREVQNVLSEYDLGLDRIDQDYMYNEDYMDRPFINTKLMTNKLFFILDILGTPERQR